MKISTIVKLCFILNMGAAAFLWPVAAVPAQENNADPKRVLAIFVFKQGMPWQYYLEQSMRASFGTESSSGIELIVEYADQTKRQQLSFRMTESRFICDKPAAI